MSLDIIAAYCSWILL